jgi:hypothetical protein
MFRFITLSASHVRFIYSLVVYLRTLSVAQTIQRRIRLVNKELEIIWKEEVA